MVVAFLKHTGQFLWMSLNLGVAGSLLGVFRSGIPLGIPEVLWAAWCTPSGGMAHSWSVTHGELH